VVPADNDGGHDVNHYAYDAEGAQARERHDAYAEGFFP
jgi:hypothetical protein